MNQNENQNKISVSGFDKSKFTPEAVARGVRRLGWLCVVLSLLFGMVTFAKERMQYSPQYTAEATLTVSTQNKSASIGGVSVYSFYYDTATANQLTETFPLILRSNLLQDAVCEDMGLSYMPATLNVRSVEGSNMFTLSATATNPQLAYDVLNSVIENYPTIAKYAVGNMRFEMISVPTVPTQPSNSRDYLKTVVSAMAIGFGIGCAIMFVYIYSRNTIKSKQEIKEHLAFETIGTLPHVRFKKQTIDFDRSILVVNEKIDQSFHEAVRVFRNVFKNSLKDKDKVIIGTSTAPGEGKTTVITNLALTLAEPGKKILLVDGDLRNPSVALLLGFDQDEIEYETVTEKYKIAYLKQYGIYFMVFNTETDGQIKYMNSTYVKDVFESIRDQFDLILVDTPPCGLVSDAMFFAQAADAAFYVILQDAVRVSKIQSDLNNLLATDIRVVGCVLNNVRVVHMSYGYGYKKYGYGYGYGYGHKSKYSN